MKSTKPPRSNTTNTNGASQLDHLLSDAPFKSFENGIESIANVLQGRKNIVVLVGAGISVSCGIPDFRSEKTGIYHNMDANELGLSTPEELFHLECFQDDPRPFYKFATKMLYPIKALEPSPSHYFLSILEKKNILRRVYTQNIDGLEEKAGVSSNKIVYAHGTLSTSTCLQCGSKASADELRGEILLGNIPTCKKVLNRKRPRKRKLDSNEANTCNVPHVKDDKIAKSEKLSSSLSSTTALPTSKPRRRHSTSNGSESPNSPSKLSNQIYNPNSYQYKCNGVMKPNITFFGEQLVDRVRKCLESDRKKADAVIVIGTSLSVAPMSKIIEYLSCNIPRILINQKIVVPKHGVYGEDGGRKMNTHNDDEEGDSSSDCDEKDHRSGYIFDACLLGNCDSVTKSLMNAMKIPKSCSNIITKDESISTVHTAATTTTHTTMKPTLKNNNRFEILDNMPDIKAQVTEKMLFRHPRNRIILFPGAMLGKDKTDNEENSSDDINENDKSTDIVYKEVVHCDGCLKVVEETVMKCSDCFDYDLCGECYSVMSKKHFAGLHHFIVEKI